MKVKPIAIWGLTMGSLPVIKHPQAQNKSLHCMVQPDSTMRDDYVLTMEAKFSRKN
jgi:hypothetical protein